MADHDARALTKAQRLSRISHLLYRHPRGLCSAEMARLCGVSTRTIQRDLLALHDLQIPVTQDEGMPPRYALAEGYSAPHADRAQGARRAVVIDPAQLDGFLCPYPLTLTAETCYAGRSCCR